jgi:hypothetical protein
LTIKLYKQLKDRDIIEKKLTEEISFTGHARDEIDVESPVILIESSSDLAAYNYVYIEEFTRYYFIEKHRIIRNNLWEFTLQEDYLFSWKDIIYTWNVQLERAQYLYNMYLNDGQLSQMAGNNFTQWNFKNSSGNPFKFPNTPTYYILTAGD